MAEHDWYAAHEKDVVLALKKGKSAPRESAVSCSLVRAKDGAFLICAHVAANKASAMVKEARNLGAKIIAAGRLFSGEDGVTFEVDTGDLSVKQKFSTAALALGSPMSVVVKAAPGAVLEGATGEHAGEKDKFQELYNGLLETIPGDLQRLRAVDPATAEKVRKVVDGAAVHAGKGEFQQAYTYLNQAAGVIAKAMGAGRVKEAVETIPEGKVEAMKAALSRAQSRWDAAVTAARNGLKPVQAALKAELPSAAAGLGNMLDSYEQELLEELRAGQAKADEEGLAEAMRGTLEKVQRLRAEAADDDVFSYLEECGVPVKAAFAEAFDEVESLLQA